MAGKYPRRHQDRKITLDADRYLRYQGGRWRFYQHVAVANSPGGEYAWYPRPISPHLARKLMEQAGIEGDEE